MLHSFKVENFLSIKYPIEFSMVSEKDDYLIENTFQSPKPAARLNKTALIYGSNASGKSNIFSALSFIVFLVKNSHSFQQGIFPPYHNFAFDDDCSNRPTSFEINYFHNNIRYRYGFSVLKGKITEEYLYYFPNIKRSIIFERTNSNYNFTKDIFEQQAIAKRTPENKLYLSSAAQWNYPLAVDAFSWFLNVEFAGTITTDDWRNYTAKRIQEDDTIKREVLNFIAESDIGIDDIITQSEKISDTDLFKSIPEAITHLLDNEYYKIRTIRKYKKNDGTISSTVFDLDQESAGTIKLFCLSAKLIETLNSGGLLFIDELDAKMHPKLIEQIVKRFNSSKHNKSCAQLIFSTHNTNMMNSSILRRDQIWFVEKSTTDLSSNLFSLTDINPRKNENFEKGYLAGRYGAIPFFE